MSGKPVDSDLPRHDALAALRQPNFLLFTGSRFCYSIGSNVLQIVILWQVYEISHSALKLGVLGLARLLPALALSMVGGAVADTYNRRNIIMITQSSPLICSIILAVSTLGGWVSLELIYGLVVFMGLAAAFEGPARQALLPSIVRPETYANAVNVNSTTQALAAMSGPVIGSTMISAFGIGTAYALFTVLSLTAMVLMSFVRLRGIERKSGRLSLETIKEGITFVRTHQVQLGAMTLDLFATIFGGVKGLLPIFASDILKVGVRGYGLFNTFFAIGAFSVAFLLLMHGPVQRTGRALMLTVACFGIGTILFGLSRNFYLSLLLFTLIGAADQVSVVMRQTTIQMATPDYLRGRVSSVNQVFVQSSNQINAFESGLVASLTSATFAVVTGGLGTLLVVGTVGWRLPQLWAYRVPRPLTDLPLVAEADEPDVADSAAVLKDEATRARPVGDRASEA